MTGNKKLDGSARSLGANQESLLRALAGRGGSWRESDRWSWGSKSEMLRVLGPLRRRGLVSRRVRAWKITDLGYGSLGMGEAERSIVGRTILEVRPMTEEELAEQGWHDRRMPNRLHPAALVLDNGDVVFPSRDAERNNHGQLVVLREFESVVIAFDG